MTVVGGRALGLRVCWESSSKGGRIKGVSDKGKGGLCPKGSSWP